MSPTALSTADDQQYLVDYAQLVQQLNTNLQMQRSLAVNSIAQSIPNANTPTYLSFDTNVYDNGTPQSIHSTSVNLTRFTALVSGFYLVVAQINWGGNATGTNRFLAVQKNGGFTTPSIASEVLPMAAACQQVIGLLLLNATDYIEYLVLQDAGAAINTVSLSTWGSLTLLSRF